MIQDWNADQIIRDLHRCAREMNDHYNDGYVQCHCKQDLYRVKFELDQLLKSSPHFSMEAEWLEQQQKRQVWKILNDKTSNHRC
jgi:hypothetical protein